MARIRTIKPSFFTSDDVCALSPLARLLYIGLWCEADREGRMIWTPKAFKRRYLPDDDCEIDALCAELVKRNMVQLYGEGLACIPSFAKHQHVNPREAQSDIAPPPDASPRVTGASNLELHTQGGKERKEGEGKEGNAATRRVGVQSATRLPDDWKPSDEDRTWAGKARPDLTPALLDMETERFRNHANANNRTAHNWGPNWRNWIGKAPAAEAPKVTSDKTTALPPSEPWEQRMRGYKPGGFWKTNDWGKRPEEPGTRVPPSILATWREGATQ